MSERKKIVVFSGAGISAESGVATFRDKGGLWDEYKVEDVATPDGWRKNRARVLEFYNKRRAEMKTVFPNDAHTLVAELEKDFDVVVITQNVDDLHERAGSTDIIHLHGELGKVRSSLDDSLVYDWTEDCNIGDKCAKGSQLRPHVIWFGEPLDHTIISRARQEAEDADAFIIVGTSLNVEPAASLFRFTSPTCLIYYVDPAEMLAAIPAYKQVFFYHFEEKATTGMKKVSDEIRDIFLPS